MQLTMKKYGCKCKLQHTEWLQTPLPADAESGIEKYGTL
jgi:hypothetical protein